MCQKFAIFATGTSDSTPVLKRLLTYIVIALSYLSMGAIGYVPQLDVYGRGMESRGDLSLVPFRYQGQYYDRETGLAYNRFRYYSPQMGMYISSDPIGLAGNNPTLYGYVQDVNTWLDVFGLDCAKAKQNHHYATNKNKKWTGRMEAIAHKYGLDLDGDWNKEILSHQGRHPDKYHSFVLTEMQNADAVASKAPKEKGQTIFL